MDSSQTQLQKLRVSEEAIAKYKLVRLRTPEDIREKYGDKPISLLRLLEPTMKFPKKIRILFALLWLQQDLKGNPANRFIIKGPRGGGKSKLLGAIGFVAWYLKYYSIVDMAGSLNQAKEVYKYFSAHCYSHPAIIDGLPREPTINETKSERKNYFKAVAASEKQIRGPHPDWLLVDEACEAEDSLILAAMPMVGSSPNQCIVLTSTFHKIFGLFQEVWDNADEMGYVRFSWDAIDVVHTFDPAIFDDERLNAEVPDLHLLKKRIGGRTGDPEGWINIKNVIQAWREKRSIQWFDVEYMGSRPSADGMVLDPEDIDACTYSEDEIPKYTPGATVVAGLDWGFAGMTAWVELMEYTNERKVQLNSKNWSKTALGIIIKDIIVEVEAKKITYIYADSAGTFENIELQNALNLHFKYTDHKCVVIPVVFSKEKFGRINSDERDSPSLIGNYRSHFQRRLLMIPAEHKVSLWQHKRYRYVEGTDKTIKKDDHIPDATMCVLKHWPLGSVSTGYADLERFERNSREINEGTFTGGLLDEDF